MLEGIIVMFSFTQLKYHDSVRHVTRSQLLAYSLYITLSCVLLLSFTIVSLKQNMLQCLWLLAISRLLLRGLLSVPRFNVFIKCDRDAIEMVLRIEL